jgi:hypothetical protein
MTPYQDDESRDRGFVANAAVPPARRDDGRGFGLQQL